MRAVSMFELNQTIQPLPVLRSLPQTPTAKKSVQLELVEGALIFRVTPTIQKRIGSLLKKQRSSALNTAEETELQAYEEMDDYLSFVNRLTRNLLLLSQERKLDGVGTPKAS